MFVINNLFKRSSFLLIHERYKSKIHWAKLKKKTGPKHKALSHFDEFYSSVFEKKWDSMKRALIRNNKYIALINNYGNPEETIEYLSNRGAHCLEKMMAVQKEYDKNNLNMNESELNNEKENRQLEEFTTKLQSDEIANIYSQSDSIPERLETADITLKSINDNKGGNSPPTISETDRKEQPLNELDVTRIIDPSFGLTSDSLWQYVPATKLKGMEDWVPESLHYSYYTSAKDFPLVVEPETDFTFPEHLKVLTYEMDSEWSTFPEPKRCETGVFNYYPMDGGSVLPVLALCLAPGDRVLDLCSAPGGKALVALQTLLPDIIVCNDASLSRLNRMQRIFKDYLFDFETSNKWRERVLIQNVDGRVYQDNEGFDKVLVDVPCTTDRHSVMEDENNIFRSDRVKERLKIPELQSQLLANALKLVRPGGAVVYSTCTLSPIQNDGVVHMALKQAFELHGILATVRDMTKCFSCLSGTMVMGKGSAAPRYGQLVTPDVTANFGPTYFARLLRTK